MVYNQRQKDILQAWFEHNPYPDKATRKQLAEEIGIPESKIQVRTGFLFYCIVRFKVTRKARLTRSGNSLMSGLLLGRFSCFIILKNKNKNKNSVYDFYRWGKYRLNIFTDAGGEHPGSSSSNRR